MKMDVNELNFSIGLREKLERDHELSETLRNVLDSKLLKPTQAKQLAETLATLPSFHSDYSHEVLRDLQTAGILNKKNIAVFFSLLPYSSFLSHMALILTVKKVMSPAEQAQKNFDLLCEFVRTRLKGSLENIENMKKNMVGVLDSVINISMSVEQFQETFQTIMKFALAPELIKQMADQLKAIYQQNFANYLRSQQMSPQSIEKTVADIFSQTVSGSSRKLKNYKNWQKTKALTIEDFRSVVDSINDDVLKKKAVFSSSDSVTEHFTTSPICDFPNLTNMIFSFFSPEITLEKKQSRAFPTDTPLTASKDYSPSIK